MFACHSVPAVARADDPRRWEEDPDLHLEVQRRRVEAERRDGAFVFRLVLPCGEIRLCSRSARPAALGMGPDERLLGVRIAGLTLVRQGHRRALPLDHPDLHDGLHEIEATGARWTNGAAVLPPGLFAGAAGDAELVVEAWALPHYPMADDAAGPLLARFENLGDNCEFGLVQRGAGIEPMSLLRWVGTDAARLVLGLCRRFEGVGDPAHTRLEFRGDPPDYKLRDPRYFSLHTWTSDKLDDPAREEEMRLAGCARLRLLRRKLLADIEAGERIFVFKSSREVTHPDSFVAVHAALRGIGPAPLLCVVRAETPAQVGQVEDLGDGLYLGRIDQFSRADVSHDAWRRVCAATAALVDAAPARAA